MGYHSPHLTPVPFSFHSTPHNFHSRLSLEKRKSLLNINISPRLSFVCTEESVNMHITYSVTLENSTKRKIRLRKWSDVWRGESGGGGAVCKRKRRGETVKLDEEFRCWKTSRFLIQHQSKAMRDVTHLTVWITVFDVDVSDNLIQNTCSSPHQHFHSNKTPLLEREANECEKITGTEWRDGVWDGRGKKLTSNMI